MEITMAWTVTARRHYVRRNSRYATDLTDAEWSVIEPLMRMRRLCPIDFGFALEVLRFRSFDE